MLARTRNSCVVSMEGWNEIWFWQQRERGTPSISTSLLEVMPPFIDTFDIAACTSAARPSGMPMPNEVPGVTPVVSAASARMLRPFSGRSRILRFSMTWPSEASAVSSSGVAATTETLSVTVPTCILMSMEARWPTCSTTPRRRWRRNPWASTRIS